MPMIRLPQSENERLYASVIIVFIVYFALNSLIFNLFGEDPAAVQFLMTLSFIGGMTAGVLFFLFTGPVGSVSQHGPSPLEKNLIALKKALSPDEKQLLDIIAGSEGVTQDSLRFRTGFSKSKVSALVSELERKDIVVREKLGRTYRLLLSDWIKE